MQKKLSQKAGKEPEHQFENLYGLLCNEHHRAKTKTDLKVLSRVR
jgi:hypothetical protein